MTAAGDTEVGGTIADVERWQKYKLPFVHIQYGVAYEDNLGCTVKLGPYDEAAFAHKVALALEGMRNHENVRVLKRHYSDWVEIPPLPECATMASEAGIERKP